MLCLMKMLLGIGTIIILRESMLQLNHSRKNKLLYRHQHQLIHQVNIFRKILVVAQIILILLDMSMIIYLTHHLRSFRNFQNYIKILKKFLILMLNNVSFVILQLMNQIVMKKHLNMKIESWHEGRNSHDWEEPDIGTTK